MLDQDTELLLELRVPASVTGMDDVHSALAGCWISLEEVRPLEHRWRAEFSLAVAEVAANIIQHAHAPDPPLEEFTLKMSQGPDYLKACFVDRGIVVTPPDKPVMPSVAVPYEELGERGRGLALVDAVSDHFEYQRTASQENIWIILKRFPV
jgi:serine/threonine-protein kinase RsbW